MSTLFNKNWCKAAGVRALKTVAQTCVPELDEKTGEVKEDTPESKS